MYRHIYVHIQIYTLTAVLMIRVILLPLSPPMQPLESGLNWSEELHLSLKSLAVLLRDEKTISAYEVHTNRLVPILLHCLTGRGKDGLAARKRMEIFRRVFAESALEPPPDLDSR